MNIKKECSKLLKENRITVKGNTFTLPSKKSYSHQWLWDSCFHAIVLRHFSPGIAKKEIISLLKYQWNNGKIPHMIYWKQKKYDKRKENWGTTMPTSSITQPPMIAYAVLKIYETTKDLGFVKKVFQKIDKYYRWLAYERDPQKENIISIIHPWESGEDNSINWDYVMGFKREPSDREIAIEKRKLVRKYRSCYFDDRYFLKKNYFNSKNISFNCIYLKNLECMAELAGLVGKTKRRGYYLRKYKKVKSAIKSHFYNPHNNSFHNIYGKKRKILDKTADKFLFLFAGLLNKKQAKYLIENILKNKKRFWTDFPIPTVNIKSVRFNPERYWRGTVWININWFVVLGLLDYGYFDVAKELVEKSIMLIEKSGFREYYNPKTGAGLGARGFSWTTLVYDMLKELEKHNTKI